MLAPEGEDATSFLGWPRVEDRYRSVPMQAAGSLERENATTRLRLRPLPTARWANAVAMGLSGYAVAAGLITLVGWALDLRRVTDWGGASTPLVSDSPA